MGDLKEYELRLRKELVKEMAADGHEMGVTENYNEDEALQQTQDYLDIKYCHPRNDIPLEQQVFDSLNVKVTKEVVSLFDFSAPVLNIGGGKKTKRCRQRRRQKRKEKKVNDVECADIDAPANDVQCESQPDPQIGSAFTIHDWEQYTPAEHLSPLEWNDKLLSLSQQASKSQQTPQQGEDDQVNNLPEDAILLDARNIYETRVGHFAVPNLPTFFPNTRKFSSLPMALNTPEAAEALAGKKVFMYCTGERFVWFVCSFDKFEL
jgi:hypothetical protein